MATITGVLNSTPTYIVCAVVGATTMGAPILMTFTPPLQSSAVNTAIVVTVPALGVGNTNAAVNAHGYVQ